MDQLTIDEAIEANITYPALKSELTELWTKKKSLLQEMERLMQEEERLREKILKEQEKTKKDDKEGLQLSRLWLPLTMLLSGLALCFLPFLLQRLKTARERSRKKAWEAKFIKQH